MADKQTPLVQTITKGKENIDNTKIINEKNNLVQNIPVTKLNGIGPRTKEALNRLDINSVMDLLLHFPISYQDRTHAVPIANLEPNTQVLVSGYIKGTNAICKGHCSIFNFWINDSTGELKVTIFNFKPFQVQMLNTGSPITIFGKISLFGNSFQMTNPEFEDNDENRTKLTPLYNLTYALKMQTMRHAIDKALLTINDQSMPELIPSEILYEWKLPTLKDALYNIHHPNCGANQALLLEHQTADYKRLIKEELTSHNLTLIALKKINHKKEGTIIPPLKELTTKFIATLPFTPTNAQLHAFEEISNDLNSEYPMNRLVQGDVGSGKTLVAILATLQAIGNGAQAVVMAPTEILAEQHSDKFTKLLSPLGFKVATLLGKQKSKEKNEQLQHIINGDAQIIIGTQAVFQKGVKFKNLRLIIIDEQHKFGVAQRLAIRSKAVENGKIPHMLTMTATPIPRTLAQTIYADMQISIINELPPGRTPITTLLMPQKQRDKLLPRIIDNCKHGLQVYWVCSLIEESDNIEDCQDVENTLEYLKTGMPELKIDLIHGRMKGQEKENIMNDFKDGKIDVLVSTSVIEVGVDVPNAFLIVIENAERYGLAQLHQLRGRVGRGKIASYCCLLYSDNISNIGVQRLKVLKESTDGFYIAQKDMEIRGPGDILGTRQTGELNFNVADLIRDNKLMIESAHDAEIIDQKYPDCTKELINRWFPEGAINSEA